MNYKVLTALLLLAFCVVFIVLPRSSSVHYMRTLPCQRQWHSRYVAVTMFSGVYILYSLFLICPDTKTLPVKSHDYTSNMHARTQLSRFK